MEAFQKLTQIGQPSLSPAEVQEIITKQLEPRFQALIDQSKARCGGGQGQGMGQPKPPAPAPMTKVPPVVRPLPRIRR